MDQFSTRLALPEAPRDFGFWIDNAARDGREMFTRFSPGHGVAVTRIPKCTVDDLNAAVASARAAFESRVWAGISGAERAGVLLRTAEILRRRRDEIAYWEVLENGKPISQARGEIDHCIACFEVGAGAARLLHGDSFNSLGDSLFGMVLRERGQRRVPLPPHTTTGVIWVMSFHQVDQIGEWSGCKSDRTIRNAVGHK